ncbi:MAG: DinB family protein [Leptospiraceae bacterium]|nr:DinB family protein [Leptospiraceae bacterium]
MHTFPVLYEVNSKEELLGQVNSVNDSLVEFYRKVPDSMLFSEAVPEGWTIAQNMNHIISTNKMFAFWFSLPNFILKLRGKPSKIQLKLEEIKPTNRAFILDYGSYEVSKTPKSNEAKKEKLLNEIIQSNQRLVLEIQKKSELELEEFSSLFGGMNLKVGVLFLLKHNIHHSNVAKLRLDHSKI